MNGPLHARSRRAFLRGAGVGVALPWLESLVCPRTARAAKPPLRFVGWHIPNGVWRPSWFPTTEGAGYALSPTLAPLEKVKKKTLIFSGIQNNDASVVNGSHGLGVAGMLTCRRGTKAPEVNVGVSVDQVFAQQLGTATRIQSMQLGTTDRMYADVGHPAVYNGCISWASASRPLQPVIKPDVVFDQIFAGARPDTSAADRERRRALRTSVLDHVLGEARKLNGRLGTTDRHKLDEYMSSVRSVETQVQSTTASCTSSLERPMAQPVDGPARVKVMVELMVLALQCDATRVITFMLGNGGSSCFSRFPWINVSEDHHGLAHHQGRADKGAKLAAIEKWEVEQLAMFLERLDAIDEGGTTLLDNGLVFLSSELGDGNAHDQRNKPIVLAGSAGGVIKSGRHIKVNNEPQADLFIAVLNALGVPATTFGAVGKRPLAGLT